MNRFVKTALVAAMGFGVSAGVFTDDEVDQTVTFEVQPINEISVSGSPNPLIINSATAGSAPTPHTDSSTTYAITTNQVGKKITAEIDENMPTGVILNVHLAAPTNATAANNGVDLTTNPADVVTSIDRLNEAGKTITYTLSATSAAGTQASTAKTVTFTIADGT